MKEKGVTGSTLKIFAIVTMFIDHFSAVLLNAYIKHASMNGLLYAEDLTFFNKYSFIYYLAMVMRLIGRLAFPIFIFCLVEGFHHTRSRAKYVRNLAIFAVLSEIPFNLALTSKLLSFDYQSVMLTMLIGVLAMWAMDKVKQKEQPSKVHIGTLACFFVEGCFIFYIVYYQYTRGSYLNAFRNYWWFIVLSGVGFCTIMLAATIKKEGQWVNQLAAMLLVMVPAGLIGMLSKCDYGASGVLAICFAYLFYGMADKKNHVMTCAALTIMNPVEGFAFLGYPLVKKYNGERGLKMKYFFYAFYPVHILLIYLVTYACGWTGFAVR